MDAPQHAFEVRISIGANTREYVIEALKDIIEDLMDRQIYNSCSGGWNGGFSITTVKRDITPDAYRKELEEWRASL